MSLYSEKRLHSYIWGDLTIDQDVICRVEQLKREEKQLVLDNNQPLFEWLPGKYIEDFHNDPIIPEEEESHENQAQENENKNEQQQEREQE